MTSIRKRLHVAAAIAFVLPYLLSAAEPKAEINNALFCDELEHLRDAVHDSEDNLERILSALNACQLQVDASAEDAARALANSQAGLSVSGNVITFFARRPQGVVILAGTVETPMKRIEGSEYLAARFRFADINHALIHMYALDENYHELPGAKPVQWRGLDAPTVPESKQQQVGSFMRRKLWSDALQETRRVDVYLPPGYEAGKDYPVIYAGDGGYGWQLYFESMIERHEIPPVVLVGDVAGQEGIVEDRASLGIDLRAADYLPAYAGAGDRFDRHMRYFAEELVPYIEKEFSVSKDRRKRVVQGESNSAVFAKWAGIVHPELFGTVLAFSAGWKPPVDLRQPGQYRTRFILTAGLYEEGFYVPTRRSARELRRKGYDVTEDYVVAGHDPNAWAVMLTKYLPQIFPLEAETR